jgi:GTPase SAR1 family protein
MTKISANSFLEVSSKTGENIKELFDKVSKGLYKKYQSSTAFKQLVQPMTAPDFSKSQSFNLKNNFGGGKN